MDSDFSLIANEATILAKKELKIDWAAVVAVFLATATFGALAIDIDDNDALRQVPMPDDWLQAVASLPDLSLKGLELLSRDLS